MQLTNSFTIARPADEVYAAFLEVDRIAACMPGSALLGQPEPGAYEGEVKVKVGPLAVTYTGLFVIVSADDTARRLKMRATGREKRGAGSAEAQIVATLTEADGRTTVRIDTDLDIRGKVAQFGRGVIGEVTDGIMQTFARNVEAMLVRDAQGAAAEDVPPVASTARAIGGRDAANSASNPSAADAGDGLDAWSLIVRPLLQRRGGGVALVAFVALAAWFGSRAGARSGVPGHACRAVSSRHG